MKLLYLFIVQCSSLSMPKLCVNCIHFMPDDTSDKYGKCDQFIIESDNNYGLMTGEYIEEFNDFHYCTTARNFDHMCGKHGKKYKSSQLF